MRASQPSQDDRDVAHAYDTAELQLLRWSPSPLPACASPIVLSVVKNEIDFIRDFLNHYRKLGVERFAIIDNGSRDGTLEHLLAQPDVDVFRAEDAFEWRRKQAWINRAVDYYGTSRWYLSADADERLAYEDYEQRSVQDLIGVLEARGLTRVRGFLLEMYSDMPIILSASNDVDLHTAYPFYDPNGYAEEHLPHIISRLGGVRARAFGKNDPEFKPQLTKYPLFRLDAGEIFSNPHHVWPYEANFYSPCHLAVLHYKFHGDWANRVNRAVADKNYWDGSREYRAYADAIARHPSLSLWNADSHRLSNSEQLVVDGLIDPIGWTSTSDAFSVGVRLHRATRLQQLGRASELVTLNQGSK